MADTDLFDDDEYRMMGTAFVDAEPLPPGLDWDYFGPRPGFDDAGELGDTENPAVDAVFDWGQPLIGAEAFGFRQSARIGSGGRVPRGRPNVPDQLRACIPQPCVPIDQWPRRPMLVPARVGRQPFPPPKPCPPRPCGVPRAPAGWTSPVDSFHVGQDFSEDWEICERVPVD